MVKVALSNPRVREVKDLASPAAVHDIWADAARAVREEAPVLQRRRRRARLAQGK
ncbi:MAG TPA: hypothetical protein PLZ93_10750 [Nocardioides sp.]|uniref:hypothetical protein n=1 Tax=uncultured Nocardioides sp. TaxID=198441 RepID=UPI00263593FF|nr:hypothetical protein [uncultured Nocardioides sp.]HRD60754.1 hypothetical protein [Nocardioides sp.]HRI96085.1 hypothetical protein [Nocardioides sp.]HRK45419.1 hypothetical protein [Nocardioides sp.]